MQKFTPAKASFRYSPFAAYRNVACSVRTMFDSRSSPIASRQPHRRRAHSKTVTAPETTHHWFVELTRGEGSYLWDTEGRRYIDMMSAYFGREAGHSHPELVDVLQRQAARLAITSRAFYTDRLGPFEEAVCRLTGLDCMLPMNTGAEAVETAIKAARKWGHKVKGIPASQAQIIIVAEGNFAAGRRPSSAHRKTSIAMASDRSHRVS